VSDDETAKVRKQMREKLDKMSPGEREKARSEWRKKMMQEGALSPAGNEGGRQTFKPRRQAQVNNENEIRWRIVLVKDAEDYKPRYVKTAASNFDNTEIVDGLKEGDEVMITSISRAKIASERMTERMRSSSPLGGTGGGRGVPH